MAERCSGWQKSQAKRWWCGYVSVSHLAHAAIVGPLAARVGRRAANVEFAPVVIIASIMRRQDHIVPAEVDCFLGTEPGVVHDCEEGDQPRSAPLLSAHRLQQRSSLGWVHDAAPVHLTGDLGHCPLDPPDRVHLQQAQLDRVVHRIGQDGAVPSGRAGSRVLPVQSPRRLVKYPAGHRHFGQR